MATSFDDIEAKCPFYQGLETINKYACIKCEGVTDKTIIKLQFIGKRNRDEYKALRCDNDYESCTLAKMLDSKYDGGNYGS